MKWFQWKKKTEDGRAHPDFERHWRDLNEQGLAHIPGALLRASSRKC